MQARRNFLKRMAIATAGFSILGHFKANGAGVADASHALQQLTPEQGSYNEDLWNQIRLAYPISRGVIYLNSGGVSPHPKVVQDALFRYHQLANLGPSLYMNRHLKKEVPPLRRKLAALAGCQVEELSIKRNTTEALTTVIMGLNLQAGDEVVLARQDYPNMVHAWKQREKRDNITLVWVDLPMPSDDGQQLIEIYKNAFTRKTKVVHLTHVNNWTGQMLPVKDLCRLAKERNIQTVVDGAHSFAQINFRIDDLDCDYFGTSLHKWLSAPLGTGLLYVRKSLISQLWPLYATADPYSDSIYKFEGQGTHDLPNEMAIGEAITFHEMIGIDRKEARLRYLKKYFAEKISSHPRIKMLTPEDPQFSTCLVSFDIDGTTNKDIDMMVRDLLLKYNVLASIVNWAELKGIRVTPNVFTNLKDLDQCSEAIIELIES